MSITVPSYAKINLFLDIDSIRENGYHNIISLMQCVSLHDDVTVSFTPSEEKKISVFCSSSSIPCDESNLAYKAANIFPANGEIIIKIEKRIPVSAGLAGGSSNAAAVLVALNKLTGEALSTEELCAIGARLGADVPFCIKGGACLAEGIGEILTPVRSMPRCHIVIAKKGEGMSTPAAYKALDEKYNRFIGYVPLTNKLSVLTAEANTITSITDGLFNIFESVVECERPAVTEIKGIMMTSGAVGAMMSGSGTSVFGIFNSEKEAVASCEMLTAIGADAHLCYPI